MVIAHSNLLLFFNLIYFLSIAEAEAEAEAEANA